MFQSFAWHSCRDGGEAISLARVGHDRKHHNQSHDYIKNSCNKSNIRKNRNSNKNIQTRIHNPSYHGVQQPAAEGVVI